MRGRPPGEVSARQIPIEGVPKAHTQCLPEPAVTRGPHRIIDEHFDVTAGSLPRGSAPGWLQSAHGYRHGCHDRWRVGRQSTNNNSTPVRVGGGAVLCALVGSVRGRKVVPLSDHRSPTRRPLGVSRSRPPGLGVVDARTRGGPRSRRRRPWRGRLGRLRGTRPGGRSGPSRRSARSAGSSAGRCGCPCRPAGSLR